MALRLGLVALLCLASASISQARPLLEHASPASGSAVRNAPSEIELSFSEALVPLATDAVVRDASGRVVNSGKALVTGKAGKISVPVKSLPPGKYRVEWYVTSANEQHAQGSYNFIVGGIEQRKQGRRHAHLSRH